jgi:ABC-type multidrug transport system fused ATPase/permease subunit
MAWFGLEAEEYDRVYSNKELFTRMVKKFKPHSRSMSLVVIFMTLTALSAGMLPILTKEVINQIDSNPDFIFIVVIIILALNLLGFIFNYVVRSNMNRVVYLVCYKLRRESNYRVLMQDLSFFDKFPTGKIVSRINSDGQKVGEASNLFTQAIAALMILVIVIIPMLIVNWLITLILLGLVPIMFVFAFSFRKVARRRTLLGQRSLALVNAFVQESMSGIQIIKTFRQEKKLYDEFQAINKQSYKVNMRRALFMNILYPSLDIIVGIIFALLIFFGGNAVVIGQLQVGDLYMFFQSSVIMFQPLFQLASFWPQFQDGMSAAERMFSLMDSESEIKEGNYVHPELKGKIEFENLNFSYVNERAVFENFNLTIQPGESVAIVGHTGAGKTSIARMLMRLYEFQSDDNSLRIDGKSIRDLNLSEYRKKVGYIGQVPFLWDDTIENNVKYGVPLASREQVISSLKQAGGIEWIEGLDNGLNTQIMERGKLLSMGQKQLLVFARVLLQNPSILILDEATASVDPFTETLIQEAMEKVMEGRTTIIIAHRLVTVRHVDRIIVLDHGKIIEEGNHEKLIAKKGYYAELYNTYFRHQSYEFLEKMDRKIEDIKIEQN